MASIVRSLPLRVGVIAVTITIGLAVLLLVVNRLGRPATLSEALTDDEARTSMASGAELDTPPSGKALQVATELVTLQLFLIDSSDLHLVSRIQNLEAPMTLAAKAQLAIEQLINAVDSPLPPETEVREVWVSTAGIAYVDFGADLPISMPKGSLAEIHAVYGVVGTLTASFPQIRAVQFLVDGTGMDTLTGHFDLAGPVSPHGDWLY